MVWNMDSGMINCQQSHGHASRVCSVTYSSDGTRIPSGGTDHTVRVWDPATGMLVLTLTGNGDTVESVSFSSGGNYLVSGSVGGRVLKWDLNGKW